MRPNAAGRVARAATIVSVAMALSRILGFLRSSVISAQFGQNRATDILNASFQIPDTIYLILVGGGVSSAFIPVLSRYLADENREELWRVVSIAYNIVLVGIGVVLIAAILVAPTLVSWIAPGFTPVEVADTALLTRITLVAILFHSLNGVLLGTEYACQSFFATSIGPLVYNAAIIVLGLALIPYLSHGAGTIDMKVEAFAIATAVGSFLNFLVQVWGIARLKPRYTLSFNFRHPGIRHTGELMGPVMLGLSFVQLNFFINQTVLASYLPPGSINALTLASRVVLVPIMVAISVGIAVLPSLTEVAQASDWIGFRNLFGGAARSVLFLTFPASLGLIALARPVTALLFQHGAFGASATDVTVRAMIGYSVGIGAYAAYEIVSRAFYALEDTRTPVIGSSISLVIAFFLNLVGVHLFGLFGLALAYSVSGFINVGILLYLLRRRAKRRLGLSRIAATGLRSLALSLIMAAAVVAAQRAVASFPLAVSLTATVLVGAVVYMGLALFFHMEEADQVSRILRRRLGRSAA